VSFLEYNALLMILLAPFTRAYASLGIPKEADGSGGRALNTFWAPNSIHGQNKSRSYARNYVELAIRRRNYHVITNRQVTKLVSKKVGNKVEITGVEVSRGDETVDKRYLIAVSQFSTGAGRPRTVVKVRKEVIVSGGAVGSPRILQLSGIGPAGALASANVTTVIDLPGVGSNYRKLAESLIH
jgi:choline dehydrogenase